MDILKSLKTTFIAATLALPTMLTASCDDSFIFEEEGDCTVRYYIQFVYDLNMKNADAFPAEVRSVNLYAFDEEGLFVKEFTEDGDILSKPGYLMELDLEPGDYTFVGWCGLVNEDGVQSFIVPDPVVGVTTLEDLTCTLNAEKTRAMEYSDTKLHFLYHGLIEADLPDVGEGYQLEYYYTMPLTKDTNHIRVMLQELDTSQPDMKVGDYDFDITAVNGEMLYNNNIAPDSPTIFYSPWQKLSNNMGIGSIDETNGDVTYTKGIIADFMTSRLMADQQDSSFLNITKTQDGRLIAKVPYMQYALMGLDYFQQTYDWAKNMTSQELLDRMDEYELTLILEKGRWVGIEVKILSWRVVEYFYGLE